MKNRVGLGTFPLASAFHPISRDDAKKYVQKFIDEGGYYIDTAPMYGFGEVEKLLGEALSKYPRDEYYIATKCGYIDVEGKTFQTLQKSGKRDDVIRECERSLQRLKLDVIDLYFLHSPDPNTSPQETIEAMVELQKQGKIKEIGVSNVDLRELKEFNKDGKVKYIQNRFSLINRSIDEEFEKYLVENEIKLVPYQVIDRGQLTGNVFENLGNLKEGDLRIGRSDWLAEQLGLIAEWVRGNLAPLAKEMNVTVGQLSIAWALYQKYMGFVLVGGTNPEYISINLKSDSIKLDSEMIRKIDEEYAKLEVMIKEKYGVSVREFRGLNEKYY